MSSSTASTIAIIPGTGAIGFGLAWRFARAGHTILLGSRDPTKAKEAANKILAEFPNAHVQPGKNEELPLASADFVVWCIQSPIQGGLSYLKNFDFSGKIVIDSTNIFYKVDDWNEILGKTSSTEKNQQQAPSARWVAAIKTVPAAELLKADPQVPGQLYSDDTEALEKVKSLFVNAQYPISTTGPLIDARKEEENLAAWVKEHLPADTPVLRIRD